MNTASALRLARPGRKSSVDAIARPRRRHGLRGTGRLRLRVRSRRDRRRAAFDDARPQPRPRGGGARRRWLQDGRRARRSGRGVPAQTSRTPLLLFAERRCVRRRPCVDGARRHVVAHGAGPRSPASASACRRWRRRHTSARWRRRACAAPSWVLTSCSSASGSSSLPRSTSCYSTRRCSYLRRCCPAGAAAVRTRRAGRAFIARPACRRHPRPWSRRPLRRRLRSARPPRRRPRRRLPAAATCVSSLSRFSSTRTTPLEGRPPPRRAARARATWRRSTKHSARSTPCSRRRSARRRARPSLFGGLCAAGNGAPAC